MKNRLIEKLRSQSDFFSETERKIAGLILKDPQAFASRSIAEVAKMAGVSQGSVINFANKFSIGGFSALKKELVKSVEDREEEPFSELQETDGVKEALQKKSHGIFEALKKTLAINDEEALKRVADKILRAKKVELYGVFRSAVVATDFYYRLLQLGISVSFVSDVLTCALSASMLDKDSLVIAISSTGKTKDMIDAVRLAKTNGVSVVCLTANANSPLAKLSDDVLLATSSGNSVSGRDTEIRISQLVLTDALCSYLQSKIDGNGEKNYFKLKNILNSHNVDD